MESFIEGIPFFDDLMSRDVRQVAQRFGHSTETVLKALANLQPTPYTSSEPRPAPVFGAFGDIADYWID